MLKTEKSIVRSEAAVRRQKFSSHEQEVANAAICSKLAGMPELAEKNIAAYASDGSEADLKEFIEGIITSGRKIILPRSNPDIDAGYEMVEVKDLDNDLVSGKYNIPEPVKSLAAVSPEEYDRYIWLIPGVAFDTTGVRLGRGKGVYDKLLGGKRILVIGIFYEYQKFDSVPFEPHDRKIDIVVTEKLVYRFN